MTENPDLLKEFRKALKDRDWEQAGQHLGGMSTEAALSQIPRALIAARKFLREEKKEPKAPLHELPVNTIGPAFWQNIFRKLTAEQARYDDEGHVEHGLDLLKVALKIGRSESLQHVMPLIQRIREGKIYSKGKPGSEVNAAVAQEILEILWNLLDEHLAKLPTQQQKQYAAWVRHITEEQAYNKFKQFGAR